MNCLLCRSGSMRESTGTYFAQLDSCYVLIENVPCFQCDQCGEVVYAASVMAKIEDILEKVRAIESKIFILDYRKAA